MSLMMTEPDKSRGWRWRMPWSHPDDNKLPLVMFLLSLGFLAYFFANLPDGTSLGVTVGVATFAACAGGLMVVWLRP